MDKPGNETPGSISETGRTERLNSLLAVVKLTPFGPHRNNCEAQMGIQSNAPIAEFNPGFWMHPDVARLIDRAVHLIECRVMKPGDMNNAVWSVSAIEWTTHTYIRELTALSVAAMPLPVARFKPTRRQFRAHPTFENFCGFCARFARWLDAAEAKYQIWGAA